MLPAAECSLRLFALVSHLAYFGLQTSATDKDFLDQMEALEPDLCITAAYGCFLPRSFLKLPRLGTLNIHPSLLPLYRGAAPVQRSLEAGDTVAGVSVAVTVLEMDAGPILRQVRNIA